eukprot:1476887-Rhodomonas_salina.2
MIGSAGRSIRYVSTGHLVPHAYQIAVGPGSDWVPEPKRPLIVSEEDVVVVDTISTAVQRVSTGRPCGTTHRTPCQYWRRYADTRRPIVFVPRLQRSAI